MRDTSWKVGGLISLGLALLGSTVWAVLYGVRAIVPRNISAAEAAAQSGVRTAIVALAAGVVALAGLFYTDRTLRHTRARDREQAELARQAHNIDRYVAAIGHLASNNAVEQLGGVYALEGISVSTPSEHGTVLKILAGFVRERAPNDNEGLGAAEEPDAAESELDRRPSVAVQAALTILGRRADGRSQPIRVDLSRTDLRGAQLSLADLPHVNLRHADLRAANLAAADIPTADLRHADLRDTDLQAANLQVAFLGHARLEGAYVNDADLTGAVLENADLSGVAGLRVEQVVLARPMSSTKLPKDVVDDPRVIARIAAIEAEEAAYRAAEG